MISPCPNRSTRRISAASWPPCGVRDGSDTTRASNAWPRREVPRRMGGGGDGDLPSGKHTKNIPLGYSCTKSGGLSSKNRFILYRGIPLWLDSTGEGCDSIQVLGSQTRAWGSTFCTRGSLVHMVLRVLILYWCPFYARLEARLGVQILYNAKMHPKIKPLFLFCHCEAWGAWFYTDAYIYSIF